MGLNKQRRRGDDHDDVSVSCANEGEHTKVYILICPVCRCQRVSGWVWESSPRTATDKHFKWLELNE